MHLEIKNQMFIYIRKLEINYVKLDEPKSNSI